MNSYEIYVYHRALQSHFTSNYDIFKYKGKVRSSVESFEKNKAKHYYTYLYKNTDNPKNYLLSNVLSNPKTWIGEIVSDSGKDTYLRWNKYNQSLFYNFQNEISTLNEEFNTNFITTGDIPNVISLHLSGSISLETLCILLDVTNAYNDYDKRLKGDIIWEEIGFKCKKYLPFIVWQRKKYCDYLKSHFT